jgi:translin
MSNLPDEPNKGAAPTVDQPLSDVTAEILERMGRQSAVRDQALSDGRQAIRWAANSVRAIHRGHFDEAADELRQARALAGKLVADTREHLAIYWAGYVQDAMKEYAEAAITYAILRGKPIPSPAELDVEDAAYLNALAEAASELRRDVLDSLRNDDLSRAVSLLESMDEIYSQLLSIDFPDAITGGLRRTTDQLRAVLERTRGDLTITINQRRLETAIRTMEQRLDEAT